MVSTRHAPDDGIPPSPKRCWLCRGKERGDRLPLREWSHGSTFNPGRRPGGPARRRDRRDGRNRRGKRGLRCNHNDFDCVRKQRRSGRIGLVNSLNRPDGNATGVYVFQQVLEGKRLGLLRELVPAAALIAVLLNPTNANFQTQLGGVQEAARAAGQRLSILSASTERDIEMAFATAWSRAGAMLVGSDPFFNSRIDQIVTLAARHAIPAIYEGRDFVMAGGLASYGTSLADAYREVGIYTGRILKGEKPADLPVVQPTKFEFVINLKTAKALGLYVAPGLSARADEMIE